MNEGGAGGRRTLDPKLDIVFWMLFGAEQNRELLISLLNAVLRPAVPIELVEVLHAEPERLAVDDKGIALDVRARLTNGEQVDVEMQSQGHVALRERALYYWARLYGGQLPRGAPYAELKRCAVILITNFIELSETRFHSRFRALEQDSGHLLTDHFELHVLELPKLPPALDQTDEPNLLLWGKFLAATRDEDLEQLAMKHPVLKQAKDALDRLSADPDARLRAEQREMALLSYELRLGAAHREGKAEGRLEGKAEGRLEGKAEGRLEGKAELLERQLTIKFGELPADVASRLANASAAELARWSETILSAASIDEVFS